MVESIAGDQRKRTSDALERRFAFAKAELLQQKRRKQSHEGNIVAPCINSYGVDNKLCLPTPSTPSLNTSYRKANVSFPGHVALPEAKDPVYFQLSHPVHENLIKSIDTKHCSGNTAKNMVHEFLQKGDCARKYVHGSRNMKIENWIILDNIVQEHRSSSLGSIRDQLGQSKCSKKRVSMNFHKKIGSMDLPQELCKYDIYKPMYEMWKEYMAQLLQNTGKNQMGQCLLNADLHGALILVVHSKVSSMSGIFGIMIRETAETFGIISQDNKFHVVPKKLSVFIYEAGCWKITLRGDKLNLRNSGAY